jgi:hypothetical protein
MMTRKLPPKIQGTRRSSRIRGNRPDNTSENSVANPSDRNENSAEIHTEQAVHVEPSASGAASRAASLRWNQSAAGPPRLSSKRPIEPIAEEPSSGVPQVGEASSRKRSKGNSSERLPSSVTPNNPQYGRRRSRFKPSVAVAATPPVSINVIPPGASGGNGAVIVTSQVSAGASVSVAVRNNNLPQGVADSEFGGLRNTSQPHNDAPIRDSFEGDLPPPHNDRSSPRLVLRSSEVPIVAAGTDIPLGARHGRNNNTRHQAQKTQSLSIERMGYVPEYVMGFDGEREISPQYESLISPTKATDTPEMVEFKRQQRKARLEERNAWASNRYRKDYGMALSVIKLQYEEMQAVENIQDQEDRIEDVATEMDNISVGIHEVEAEIQDMQGELQKQQNKLVEAQNNLHQFTKRKDQMESLKSRLVAKREQVYSTKKYNRHQNTDQKMREHRQRAEKKMIVLKELCNGNPVLKIGSGGQGSVYPVKRRNFKSALSIEGEDDLVAKIGPKHHIRSEKLFLKRIGKDEHPNIIQAYPEINAANYDQYWEVIVMNRANQGHLQQFWRYFGLREEEKSGTAFMIMKEQDMNPKLFPKE